MKRSIMWKDVTRATVAAVCLAALLCGVYPLLVWGAAQLLWPQQANGSVIVGNGRVVGSRLLGQSFNDSKYFHPRPSLAGEGYNAASSGASNLGPLSRKLYDQVQQRLENYRQVNGLPWEAAVPVDAVTASGSGLDPHISVSNALLQASRVAQARGLTLAEVQKHISSCTEGPDLGFLGEPGVNVLRLNLALDEGGLERHGR